MEIALSVAVVVVAGVAALFTRLILKEDPGRHPTRIPTRVRLGWSSWRPVLRGEVLFARPEGRRSITLDCLMETSGGAGPRIPVQIQCSGLHLRLLGVGLGEVVLQWLTEGHRVFVEALGRVDGTTGQLILRTERGRVVLDLDDDSDVRRHIHALRHGHLA